MVRKRGLVPPTYTSEIPGDWDSLVVGAIRSDYQKPYRAYGPQTWGVIHTPLWHHDSESHMRASSHGFRLKITSVSSGGLGEDWVGRVIDERSLGRMLSASHRFHVDGEGGEYETIVLDGPCSDTQSTSWGRLSGR